MASRTHEAMPALPFHTVTQLGLEERRHPICTKGKASAKIIISWSLGAWPGNSIRALQWERRDGRKQSKNTNPSQTPAASILLFAHTDCYCHIHLAMVRHKATAPLRISQSLHSQGHQEYTWEYHWGEIKETGEKKYMLSLIKTSITLKFSSWRKRKDYQLKPAGNPSILLSHTNLQLQKGGSRMKEAKLDPG